MFIQKKAPIIIALTMVSAISCSATHSKSEQYVIEAASILDQWSRSKPELLSKAKQKILMALALNPNSVQARVEMSRYHIMNGDLSSAEQSLLDAQNIDKNHANIYVLMGHLYFLQNRIDDARHALNKAEKIGTNNPWFYMNKADILDKEYKFDEAAILWHKALENNNNNPKVMRSALGELAAHYNYKKEFKKASQYYDELVNKYPNYAYGYGNRAQYKLCSLSDTTGAIADAEKALSFFSFGHARRTIAASQLLQWAQLKSQNKATQAVQVWQSINALYIEKPLETVAATCNYNYQWNVFGDAFGKYYPVESMTYEQKDDLAYFYYANNSFEKATKLLPDKYNPKYFKNIN